MMPNRGQRSRRRRVGTTVGGAPGGGGDAGGTSCGAAAVGAAVVSCDGSSISVLTTALAPHDGLPAAPKIATDRTSGAPRRPCERADARPTRYGRHGRRQPCRHEHMGVRMSDSPGTVLVAGASGLVGLAAVERFLADGYDVIAVSRREPEVSGKGNWRHVDLDLRDPAACQAAAADFGAVTHVVYTAVFELPGPRARLERAGADGHQPGDAAQPDGPAGRGRHRAPARQPAAGHQGLRRAPPPDPRPGARALPTGRARQLLLAAGGLHPRDVRRPRAGRSASGGRS